MDAGSDIDVPALLAHAVPVDDERQVALNLELQQTQEAADAYAAAARNANTKRNYLSDWNHFANYCAGIHRVPLPAEPQTVCWYLSWMAAFKSPRTGRPLKTATIRRRFVTLGIIHRLAGFTPPNEDPLVRQTWRGIRRTHGSRSSQKEAILIETLRTIIPPLKRDDEGNDLNTPREMRDRALLLVNWSTALRRCNVATMQIEDVKIEQVLGLRVEVPFSKTNQLGEDDSPLSVRWGEHIETCPVRALQTWLWYLRDTCGVTNGPIFRKIDRWGHVSEKEMAPESVARLIQDACKRAGLDPSIYGGHSMRRGFVTTAVIAGKSDAAIMRQTKHRSLATLNKYKDEAKAYTDNPTEGLGL